MVSKNSQPIGTLSAFCIDQIVPGFVVYYIHNHKIYFSKCLDRICQNWSHSTKVRMTRTKRAFNNYVEKTGEVGRWLSIVTWTKDSFYVRCPQLSTRGDYLSRWQAFCPSLYSCQLATCKLKFVNLLSASTGLKANLSLQLASWLEYKNGQNAC